MSGGAVTHIATGGLSELFDDTDTALRWTDPADIWGARANRERERAAAAEERARRLEQRREAIEAVRQSQIAAAELQALGETSGLAGSSVVSGGVSSVKAQLGGNINFLQQQELLRGLASARVQEAANKAWAARQIQTFGAVAQSVTAGANWGKNTTTAPTTGATDGTNDTMGFSK